MKKTVSVAIWSVFFALMAANVYIFIQGVTLSDRIAGYEERIYELRENNAELETLVYRMESITNAASISAVLEYNRKSDPIFFDTEKPVFARTDQ